MLALFTLDTGHKTTLKLWPSKQNSEEKTGQGGNCLRAHERLSLGTYPEVNGVQRDLRLILISFGWQSLGEISLYYSSSVDSAGPPKQRGKQLALMTLGDQ